MESGCGGLAAYRGRCQRHAKQRERTTHPNKSFYNSARWKNTRKHQLHLEPLCRVCGMIAEEVDHIVPIEQGGDKWPSSNLQSLCAKHHGQKTRREQ